MSEVRKILGATAIGLGSTLLVKSASADTVVYSNHDADKSSTQSNQSASQADINNVNSQINNLSVQTNGAVSIQGQSAMTQAQLQEFQAQLDKVKALAQTYQTLREKLDTQSATNAELTRFTSLLTVRDVTGKDVGTTASQLQDLINQMQKIADQNDEIIKHNAESAKDNSSAMNQAVKAANQAISQSAQQQKVQKDGIISNLDTINRKSDDSKNARLLNVDNSDTTRQNTVTTDSQPKTVYVQKLEDLNGILTNILNDMHQQDQKTADQALAAGTYKDRALYNIDDLNNWLKDMKQIAADRQKRAQDATTSITMMSDYKSQTLAKLQQARAIIEAKSDSSGKTQMLQNVDDAIAKLNQSDVTQHDLPPVGQKDPYDFGDIGKSQYDQNGSQDGTIDNTKNTEKTKFTTDLNNRLAIVEESNRQAINKIRQPIKDNEDKTDKYLTALQKNRRRAQVNEAFLNTMPIYTSNSGGMYQSFIKDALAQTESNTESVQNQLDMSQKVIGISGSPSVAQLSAAMYAKGARTYGNGFGSVMFPTNNVNQIMDRLNIMDGTTLLDDSSRYSNGSWGIYDNISHMPGYMNYDWSSMPAAQDLKDQYLSTPNGQANTRTFVTNSPMLTIRLNNAFVYSDANGNIKTKPIWVTVAATAQNGESIYDRMNQNLPGIPGGVKPIYVYNFQINQYTGQLVCGVSYFATQNTAIGTGSGNMSGGTGGGEHSAAVYERYGQPVNQRDAIDGIGLAQGFWTQIEGGYADAEAAEYAQHTPLYVSDLDDGQQILYYPGARATDDKLVIPNGQGDVSTARYWNNPYGDSGEPLSYIAHNADSTNATLQKNTNLDGQSSAAFSKGGLAWGYRVVIRSPQGKGMYQSIDTSLFAPFGIVGSPRINLDAINADVDKLTVNDTNGKAHTTGQYDVGNTVQVISPTNTEYETTKNLAGTWTLPTLTRRTDDSKVAVSGNSIIVTKQDGQDIRTGSGNTMIVTRIRQDNRTGSRNTFVVSDDNRNVRTSSGNSLIVSQNDQNTKTSSRNTMITSQAQQSIAKLNKD